MNARRKIAGATAAVAGVGLTLAGGPGYGQVAQAPTLKAVGIAVSPSAAIPSGLRATPGTRDAPGSATYPVKFDITNDTPYPLRVVPIGWGDECWTEPGNPKFDRLAPGQNGNGIAWTKTTNEKCQLAYRVTILGPSGEYPLTPNLATYSGRSDELKPTFTFYFPGTPKGSAWVWAPWGYWALPERAVGLDMSGYPALYFRVNQRLDNSGDWDKCRDNNDSEINCHVTISTKPPGSIRPREFFDNGTDPRAAGTKPTSPQADPHSFPTITDIMADGCRSRGIIEERCAKVTGPGTDYSNLTVAEKSFTLETKNVQIIGDLVDSGVWVNSTPKDSEYRFSRSQTLGEDSTSTSTQSHSVGGSVSVDTKATVDWVVFKGEIAFKVKVNTEHRWESSDTKTTSKSETKSSDYVIPVPKNSKVQWRILQNAIATTKAEYTADVVIGPDVAKFEPVSSPMYSASLISPVDRQVCLATAIGNTTVNFSLLSIKDWVQKNGGVGDPSRIKQFLINAANFTTEGQCPGYPANYPVRAKFQGKGIVTDTQKGMSAACTYYTQNQASGPDVERPHGGVVEQPIPAAEDRTIYNTAPQCDGPHQGYPVAFDATDEELKDQDVIIGTEYGDLLMAKNRSDVTLLGGDSTDILEGGTGVGNVLDGQRGEDVIVGGEADEVIRGGAGADNLNGGPGDDEIMDRAGIGNFLAGGAGKDTLTAKMGRSTLSGGADKDTLIAEDGVVGMVGGKGSDTYVVGSGAKGAGVTEMPGQGRDVVKAWRSFTLPNGVEVLRLRGAKDLKATGTTAGQKVVGNAGDNKITGAGFDRLIGGPGKDTIRLSDTGFDTATGGPGADRYVLTGEPGGEQGAATGSPAMAHEITDFAPGSDKLVLSAKVHGPEVMQLKKVFRVFDPSSARTPKGSGPALVVNTKTGVVKYDHDDRGRTPDRVLVRLPKGVSLSAQEIVIR